MAAEQGEASSLENNRKPLIYLGFGLLGSFLQRGEAPRMLGKDEVASSNLASSSKNQSTQPGRLFFIFAMPELATSSLLPKANFNQRS